jgi:hypothetical protein
MFVRFRETKSRLQVSLAESRRVDGRVQYEHVAQLGSIEAPPTVEDRIAFWQRLHERLSKLSNRLDAATQGKVLGDIHARIPMVTLDEQRALKLENAEAEQRFWAQLQDMHESRASDHQHLAAITERAVAEGKTRAADAGAKAAAAKDRAERLRNGEDVPGGLGKPPMDAERIAREAGMTADDIRHALMMAELPDEAIEAIVEVQSKASEHAGRAAVRRMARLLNNNKTDKP